MSSSTETKALGVTFTAKAGGKDFGVFEMSINQDGPREFLDKVDEWLQPGETYLLTIEKVEDTQ